MRCRSTSCRSTSCRSTTCRGTMYVPSPTRFSSKYYGDLSPKMWPTSVILYKKLPIVYNRPICRRSS
jgi:hypothetical protein